MTGDIEKAAAPESTKKREAAPEAEMATGPESAAQGEANLADAPRSDQAADGSPPYEAKAGDEAPPETSAADAGSPKAEPEAFALRAQPERAIRFKRSVVIAIAAVGSLGIATTTWVALSPSISRDAVRADDPGITNREPDEALGALPKNYGDVPRLGPPLPGDLGKPILDHQRSMASEPETADAERARQAAETARERRATELKAARRSALLVKPTGRAGAQSGLSPTEPSGVVPGNTASAPLPDAGADPNGQARKASFVTTRDREGPVAPEGITAQASPYTLSAGSVIAASLITGLNSDLPGMITAQVTERVFDSATGRIELIPQGARLIGKYDSVVAFGQQRALIVWQRIVMPDGGSLTIGNAPATDPSGYAGLAGKVDFHSWALLKGISLSTLLGVGSSLTFTNESDLVQAIRESTQQNASRAGDQITRKNLQVQPTITVRPGTPVRLVVQHDLILAPWRS